MEFCIQHSKTWDKWIVWDLIRDLHFPFDTPEEASFFVIHVMAFCNAARLRVR